MRHAILLSLGLNLGLGLGLSLGQGCGPWDNDGDNFDEATNDCDDSDPNIHPYALEICDGIDNNCDGLIDDSTASGATTWYADLDRDGYGDDGLTTVACEQPEGYAPNKWDCNESNASINPGAEEICDGMDNDCDGEIDENTATDAFAWYPDYDGDGFGNSELVKYGCLPPTDYIAENGDCNDNDPLIYPSKPESCLTPVDDNCDGEINGPDSVGCVVYFADLDGDGYPGTGACLCEPDEVYYHSESNDCDDSNAELSPENNSIDVGFSDLNCDGEVLLTIGDADMSFETIHVGNQGTWQYQRRPIDIEYGDVDGDGLSDFAIAAQSYYGGSTPYVFLQTGAEHECFHELNTFTDVTIAGLTTSLFSDETLLKTIGTMPLELMDVNQDGLDDLVIAQVTASSQWEIATFFAPFASYYTLDQADIITSVDLGPVNGSYHQLSLSSLQTEEHTEAELLIGNPQRPSLAGYINAGGFKILEFEPYSQTWTTTQDVVGYFQSQRFGEQTEVAGDTNGDGISDFVVLAPSAYIMDPFGQQGSSLLGSISLYTDRNFFPSTTIVSNVFYRRIANQFAGQGDYNGDGYDDLAVSAKDSHLYQANSGRTQIFWGPLETGIKDVLDMKRSILNGHQADMEADCPTSLGDIDGDGVDDLLLGAPYFEPTPGVPGLGSAFLWFGHDFEGIELVNQDTVRIDNDVIGKRRVGYCAPGDNRRWQGSVGDINGDGLNDFLLRGDDSVIDPQFYDNLWLFYGRAR